MRVVSADFIKDKTFVGRVSAVMSKEEITLTKTEQILRSWLQHYNERRYWKYREVVIDPTRGSRLGDALRLFYIKRSDAFNNASLGTHRNFGATFHGIPTFPHGLNGIIVSHNAVIGKNCTIFHQVTIGEGRHGAPKIGDNVKIGAGAKIIGNIRVGNYVQIGAGCVVTQDVPDNTTVLSPVPVIKIR